MTRKSPISICGRILLVLLTTVLLLAGCESEPPMVSDAYYKFGMRAIEIADGYLDFTIPVADAYDQMQKLDESGDSLPEAHVGDEEYPYNVYVGTEVFLLSSELFFASIGNDVYETVKEYRNSLAELLGEPARE